MTMIFFISLSPRYKGSASWDLVHESSKNWLYRNRGHYMGESIRVLHPISTSDNSSGQSWDVIYAVGNWIFLIYLFTYLLHSGGTYICFLGNPRDPGLSPKIGGSWLAAFALRQGKLQSFPCHLLVRKRYQQGPKGEAAKQRASEQPIFTLSALRGSAWRYGAHWTGILPINASNHVRCGVAFPWPGSLKYFWANSCPRSACQGAKRPI